MSQHLGRDLRRIMIQAATDVLHRPATRRGPWIFSDHDLRQLRSMEKQMAEIQKTDEEAIAAIREAVASNRPYHLTVMGEGTDRPNTVMHLGSGQPHDHIVAAAMSLHAISTRLTAEGHPDALADIERCMTVAIAAAVKDYLETDNRLSMNTMTAALMAVAHYMAGTEPGADNRPA